MFGKDDLIDNLSRDVDRARGRRDALASQVTSLTAQIAEMEASLSEEKTRHERDRVLGELEALKKRIKDATGAFAAAIGKLGKAVERAAAIVPEAQELNSFLLSVVTEADSAVESLLRELDQRAEAIRYGQAVSDLRCSTDGDPIDPPRHNSDPLLRFRGWLSRIKEVEKNETMDTSRNKAIIERSAPEEMTLSPR